MSDRYGSDGRRQIDVPGVSIVSGVLALAAGTQTASSGTVAFSNSNNVSFGMSGSSQITGSYAFLASAGTQSSSLNGLTFAASNGVTFGLSAGTITASISTAAATGNNINVSAGTTSNDLSAFTLADSNGISFGLNASTITATYYRPVASNAIQSVGSATGSGTNTSRFAADDHVHAGVFSVGVSTAGNTSGDTRVDVGRFVFQGGNNITLSQLTAANALNTIVISGANAAGAQTAISGIANSETTYTSGTVSFSELGAITIRSTTGNQFQFSVNAQTAQTGISGIQVSDNTYTSGTVTFRNANGISFGSSGANGISASYTVPTQSNQTGGIYGISNTTGQSSSSTYDLRSLSFEGAGIASVGWSNSSWIVSATQSNQAFSADASSTFQTLTFQDSNGISFSNNGGALRITHGLQFTSNTSAITSNALNTSASRVINIIAATNNTGGGTASLSSNVSFSNANSFTFYTSAGNAIVGSFSTPAQTDQTLGVFFTGNTIITSSSTVDARSITFNMLENASGGFSSNGMLVIDVTPGFPVSAGTDATRNVGGLTLRNSNSMSWGFLAGVGSSQRITGSYAFGVSAGTQSSATNGATFSDANGVFWGYDGTNITVNPGYLSYFENAPFWHQTISHTGFGGGSTSYVWPFQMPLAGSFSYVRLPVSFVPNSTTLATTTGSYSAKARTTFVAAVYSLGTGASSRSLQHVASGSVPFGIDWTVSIAANSTQYTVSNILSYGSEGGSTTFGTSYGVSTNSVNVSTTQLSDFNGYRYLDIPFANSLSAGAYWMVTGYSTTTSTQSNAGLTGAHFDITHWGITQPNITIANMGAATNSSLALQVGVGSFTTNAIGTTASIPLANISSSASHLRPPFALIRQA